MKKMIAVLLVFTMLGGICVSAAEFWDVPQSHWAHDTISDLADKGIINGVSETLYEPDSPLTRAQFIKLIVCAMGDFDASCAYVPVFSDTPADAWYTPYIACGVQSGIISGEQQNFYPDSSITRGEAAIWMVNGLGIASDAECPFADVTDATQKKAVGIAAKSGLINGYEDGTFKPDNSLTRAEAAALISRMYKKNASYHAVREDSANEVVLKESVKYAQIGDKNNVAQIDTKAKTITFSNADSVVLSLSKDDILYVPECKELPEGLLAKVKNKKRNGNTVTVTCTQPKLEEVVDSIDVSAVFSASAEDFKDAEGVISVGLSENPASAATVGGVVNSDFDAVAEGSVTGDFKNGKLRWSANGFATEKGTIHYETDSFKDKNGAYASLDMQVDVLVDVLISGDNLKTKNVFAHANASTDTTAVFGYSKSASTEQVFKLPECEIPVAGPVKVGVTLYVVMRANGEFTVEATTNITTDVGMTYYDGEFETWNNPYVGTQAKANADGYLEIGPGVEAEVKIDCGSDFFLGDIGLVELGAEVGAGINGQVDVEQSVSADLDGISYMGNQLKPDENDIIHDCFACFYGDVYEYCQFSAGLSDDLNLVVKKYFDTELSWQSEKYTAVVTPWHFSVGGTQWNGPEFELNLCSHKLYPTEITVKNNKTNEPVSGATITVDGKYTDTTDAKGKVKLYLENKYHSIIATAKDYKDYSANFYVYADKNKVDVPMEEIKDVTVFSSYIAEYDGVTNCLRNVPGLTFLNLSAPKYDYVCGMAFYKGRLYYSCKEAGTSDYGSAIYSCKLDGSDLKLIVDCPPNTDYATHFMISGDKLYYGYSHCGSCERYYDIKTEQICSTGVPKSDYIVYVNGDNIYTATYNRSSKNYRIDRKNLYTGEQKQVASCKSIYDEIVTGQDGVVYYVSGKKVIRYSDGEEIFKFDERISNVHAITEDYIYYSYSSLNYGRLNRYNMKTGEVEKLDFHREAGGGDPYFNW